MPAKTSSIYHPSGCLNFRPLAASLFAKLLFELRRIANLDRPFGLEEEGRLDTIPRAPIVPHLDHPLALSMEGALSEATLLNAPWIAPWPCDKLQPLLMTLYQNRCLMLLVR
jgi:hypothetical protein